MSGNLDLGTLTVKLAADVAELKAGLAAATRATDETNKTLKKMGEMAFGAFEGLAGGFEQASTMSKKLRKGIEDVFGENATATGQAWGKEISKTLGLTDAQVKGLNQAVKGLEGAFEAVGVAVKMMLTPLGAVLIAAVGVAAAIGAVKNAFSQGGWAPQFMDEPWFQKLTGQDAATKGTEAGLAAMDRMAGTAPEQSYLGGKNAFSQGGWAPQFMDEPWFQKLTGQDAATKGTEAGLAAMDRMAGTAPEQSYLGGMADDLKTGIKSEWARSAATPGSAAETLSKMDPLSDLKAAFGRVGSDLEDILGPALAKLKKLMEPGATKSDTAAAEKEKNAAIMKVATAAEKTFYEGVRAQAEAELKALDEANQANKVLAQAEKDSIQMQLDAVREVSDQASMTADLMADSYRQASDVAAEALRKAEQDITSRWQALGSGAIGTAVGAKGVGGMILDQVGGAAAQNELTGAAMQGAAQGLESSGGNPWAALIGAIIALALKTEAFSSVMQSIESILGDVLPILNQAVRPLAMALEGISKILSPILNIVGWIAELLMTVAKPLDAINGLLEPISNLLNTLIDSIDISGVMDAQVKDDNGNSMSWTDAITGTGLIDAAANEITKAINGDKLTGADAEAYWEEMVNGPARRTNDLMQKIKEAEAQAKQNEIDQANRAAAALKELADSVMNSVEGYKLNRVIYGAGDLVGGMSAGNPYGGG